MNGIIKVWNTMNGQLIKTLEGPEEAEWICWHNKVNDRKRMIYKQNNVLFVSGNDYCIWSWLLPSGKLLPVKISYLLFDCVQILSGHTDIVTCCQFNPSGQVILI